MFHLKDEEVNHVRETEIEEDEDLAQGKEEMIGEIEEEANDTEEDHTLARGPARQ